MNGAPARRLRVLHVVYRFDIGGLENVIVQLINRLPADRFEHVVLSLTTVSDFRQRVEREGVRFIALDKPPGHTFMQYPALWRLLREIRPDVLHTCNLAPLEVVPLAWLARVPWRIHVEHGWDAHDPHGKNPKYRWLRRLYAPFVSRFVSVSADLDRYLGQAVGVPADKRLLIGNGVDTAAFRPDAPTAPEGCPFVPGEHWVVGTVGRMMTVKNQPLLAKAFVQWLRAQPEARPRARLLMAGEGPLREEVERVLDAAGLRHLAWLPGARSDIPEILRLLDVFVLPSQTEGTSCTLQEAMASARPVVVTSVGGNVELVSDGQNGQLVPSDDADAMAGALARYFADPALARRHGEQGRELMLRRFSIDAMAQRYQGVFEGH
jgi:sugar transferase (PEP-CTERM/EpsH1 system associated)